MREKLIELIREYKENNNGGGNIPSMADHLLENGVVVLPCKLGDVVWCIIYGKCKDVRIETVHRWVSGRWKFSGFHSKGPYREGYEFDLNDFGKTVFLTKKEAEKALERK